MKNQRVFLLMVLCVVICTNIFAQVQTPKYVSSTANSGGYFEYLPSGYSTSNKSYPLILFVHGLGELGSGSSTDLPKLLNCWVALPRLINQGQFPQTFSSNGQTFSFIVISPQFKAWPSGSDVNDVINYAIKNYKVDTTRIYVTGLSMGGGATWDFAAAFPTKATAIVPTCGASWPDLNKAKTIAHAKLPVWATHNDFDGTVSSSYTKDWVNNISQNGGIAKKTIWPSSSHDSWTKTYDPNFKENNLNVYEWMLQYQKSSNVTNQAPTANAGTDQTITLPVSSVTLTGSGADSDGSIVSYSWSKLSGPTSGSITSPSTATTTVTNLAEGTYVFQLTVTDNNGLTGKNDVSIIVKAAANQQPVAFAGNNQTIILPENSVILSGSATDPDGTIISYNWTQIAGNAANIISPFSASTEIKNLTEGDFEFKFTVTDNNGATATSNVTVTVQTQQTTTTVTANDPSSYVPYSGQYSYGLNPGWYGPNWSTKQILDLGAGNTTNGIKGIGAKSFRMQLYDDFLTQYGTNFLIPDYEHLKNLGTNEITAFVGSPHSTNRLDSSFYFYVDSNGDTVRPKSQVFKGMYEPIWLDDAKTQINPANTYAQYLFNVVKVYGDYVTFWEIVNEPDFTYSDGGWSGDSDPPSPNSWFYRDPRPDELVNLKAPLQYYIRMIRISWEVIKKLQPNDYVCTGGIGSRAFLAALLRNTDNPDGGKVTPEYPLTTGAYFDVLSFHTYPEFLLRHWNFDPNVTPAPDGFVYYRHSDAAINSHLKVKNWMDSLLVQAGYNGNKYPAKQFICTETGMSRHTTINEFGGNEVQKNYMIKAHVLTQKDGQVKQTYWFTTGDGPDANFHWDMFGCYTYFGDKQPYNATATDQGIALKTTSDLIYGKTFDATRTASLNLPASIEGAAFKAQDGSYVYVLWAKTMTDLSENASATYSFPAELFSGGSITKKEWNFSQTNDSSIIGNNIIELNGTPAFYIISASVPPTNQAPKANAGADQTITLPVNSVTLVGTGSDADGTIASYLWSQLTGPANATFSSASTANTEVNDLKEGTYQLVLTITDDKGSTAKDTVVINVNAAVNKLPVANAGNDQIVQLPTNTVNLTGSGTDTDGIVVKFEWTKISGPDEFTITSPTTANTGINGLIEGSYIFRLTVTDNEGAIDTDDVTITVNAEPANQAPEVSAGNNQSITLPVNSLSLIGTASDPDGTITSYSWSKVSGGSANIASPSSASTTITELVEGNYVFRLTATDNDGATSFDEVTVIVNQAPNKPPIANAGNDITITLPVNRVQLNGIGTDSDGSITGFQWLAVDGPSNYKISSPFTGKTTISNLTQGTYRFMLTVTDDRGGTGSDTVTIVVNPPIRTKSSATLYPNPATTTLNVKIDAATSRNYSTIRIINTMGHIVYEEEFLRTQATEIKTIDISKLEKGIYLLNLNADINTMLTMKFVKD